MWKTLAKCREMCYIIGVLNLLYKYDLGMTKQILNSWFFSKVLFKENKSVLKNIIQDGEWCLCTFIKYVFYKCT